LDIEKQCSPCLKACSSDIADLKDKSGWDAASPLEVLM
jgi:hypothetical protein